MCVGVGSFSDPQDAQGLAHFLGKWMTLLATEGLIVVVECSIFLLCIIT